MPLTSDHNEFDDSGLLALPFSGACLGQNDPGQVFLKNPLGSKEGTALPMPVTLSTLAGPDGILLLGGLGLTYYFMQARNAKSQYKLPPSPKGLPFLGNALQIPLSEHGQNYQRWGKELNSDIVCGSVLGKIIVVANTISVATDLMDKRSANYSSRPHFVMAQELMGWDYLFAMLPYNDIWRERRKAFVQHFKPGDMSIVRPQERDFVGRLLVELHQNPKEFFDVIKGGIGGFVISLTYGIPVKSKNDPHVEFSEYTIETITRICTPGAYFVDVFPILKYVPSWFPGGRFKSEAVELSYIAEQFRSAPFDEAVANLGTNKARPSFVSVGLSAIDDSSPDAAHQRQIVKDTAAMFYAAGTDTIVFSLLSWLWLTLKHPEVKAHIQAELDEVLKGKLPDLEDQASLPYLTATLMESSRYAPVSPIGVPHSTVEDDFYGDYFIPGGSTVLANMYAMGRNENDYDRPDLFNPDRFLKNGKINTDNAPNPFDYVFGFGRRSCPGKHIGLSMVYLTAASLATIYDWTEPLGDDGIPINQPLQNFESTVLCHPRHFKCDFKVRSPDGEAHLRTLAAE